MPRTAHQLRGGYYTPSPIGDFLAGWALSSGSERVLEPSCGDGALLAAAARRLTTGTVVGVELDESEAAKARVRGGSGSVVVADDVFRWWHERELGGLFEACLGNPPFLRAHLWPERLRTTAFGLMRSEGLTPNRLTASWVPFVVLATCSLRVGGRLAMVLPAQLLQVAYACELRQYLLRKFSRLWLVTFRRPVFPAVQQEVVLLCGVRGGGRRPSITVVDLEDADELASLDLGRAGPSAPALDHTSEKWTRLWLDSAELALLREVGESAVFPRIGDLADVSVGIETGADPFFVVDATTATKRRVGDWCYPVLRKAVDVSGLVFSLADWSTLRDQGRRVLLLTVDERIRADLPPAVLEYVTDGERVGYDAGYKCRLRAPAWWRVPIHRPPSAFIPAQAAAGTRVIANPAGVMVTDIFLRVESRPQVCAAELAAASVNSMTLAFAEVLGRSYGSGVLTLQPTEAAQLPVPPLGGRLAVDEVDAVARRGSIRDVATEVDRLTLEAVGLSSAEVGLLRGVWEKLSARRAARRR